MKFTPATPGRVFILRLEDGDIVHDVIEAFAKTQGISAATVTAVGGIDAGSTLVVGPEDGRAPDIVAMKHQLDNVYEATGTGTIFEDETGQPLVHMHLSCGRGTSSITGCIRSGVYVWHILEVVITELTDTTAKRSIDPAIGFKLLSV